MIEEVNALDDDGTWDLVSLPAGKKSIGFKWLFAIKVNLNGLIACLKARLEAKGYPHMWD